MQLTEWPKHCTKPSGTAPEFVLQRTAVRLRGIVDPCAAVVNARRIRNIMTTLHSEADPSDVSLEYDEAAATQMLSDSAPDTLNASIFGTRYSENSAKSESVVACGSPVGDRQQEVRKVSDDVAAERWER